MEKLKRRLLPILSNDFLVNFNYSFMGPLLYVICIVILKKSNSFFGMANAMVTVGFLLFSYGAGSLGDKYKKNNYSYYLLV